MSGGVASAGGVLESICCGDRINEHLRADLNTTFHEWGLLGLQCRICEIRGFTKV